jgi:hypothetical protein
VVVKFKVGRLMKEKVEKLINSTELNGHQPTPVAPSPNAPA